MKDMRLIMKKHGNNKHNCCENRRLCKILRRLLKKEKGFLWFRSYGLGSIFQFGGGEVFKQLMNKNNLMVQFLVIINIYLQQQMFPVEDYNQIYSQDIPSQKVIKRHQLHLFQDAHSKEIEKEKQIKKLIPPKRKTKHYWKPSQNQLYLQFLVENQELLMKSVKQRTDMKVNVRMSEHVKSRTPKQCRSHHQKMLDKYESISSVINNLRVQLRQLFDKQDLKVSNFLEFQIVLQKAQDYQYSNQMRQQQSENRIVVFRGFLQ